MVSVLVKKIGFEFCEIFVAALTISLLILDDGTWMSDYVINMHCLMGNVKPGVVRHWNMYDWVGCVSCHWANNFLIVFSEKIWQMTLTWCHRWMPTSMFP